MGEPRARDVARVPYYGVPEHGRCAQWGPAKETLLLQSGFRPFTVTTPKQQQRVSALPVGNVSTVGYKGKLYYVYPTATKGRILVGNQTQYNAYKQALVAYGVTTSPSFVEDTHGPHRILVQEFDGFGPLGE